MDTDGQQDDVCEQVDPLQNDQQSLSQDNKVEDQAQSSPPHCSSEDTRVIRLSPIQIQEDDEVEDKQSSSDTSTCGHNPERKDNDYEQEVEKEEEEFEVVPEISFLKDSSLTTSPSRSFKSSYAKSLADSYRRASLPVVVAAPKGQFYFKDDEFLSLNSSQIRLSGFNQDKFLSLNSSVNKPSLSSFGPQSLPTILDVVPEPSEQSSVASSYSSKNGTVRQQFTDSEIFIPYERLRQLCVENGTTFSLHDWHSAGSLITSDGRKLVKLSDFQEKWKDRIIHAPVNGHTTAVNGFEKDAQVESLRLECKQLEGRVKQLCEVLAERDTTIQRLEEDLLRMRMECQRLIVDNRSLKSSVGPSGTSACVGSSQAETPKMQQEVHILRAQLEKAECSRHTYEAATRQLVDFLHTVNSTLSTSAHPSASTSPTTSLHSTSEGAYSSQHLDLEHEDPPYRLSQPQNQSIDLPASPITHSFGPFRRSTETVRRAGSISSLPTHSGKPHRVNRAVSTHCVASISQNSSHSPQPASPSHDKGTSGRSLTPEFLASRAKELIASLKSVMRSDSVSKLNLEPKKSGSQGNNSCSGSQRAKSEVSQKVTPTEQHQGSAVENSLTSRTLDDHREGTTLELASIAKNDDKTDQLLLENSESKTASKPLATADSENGNPQPVSLMVVGESSSTVGDRRFSSLPNRSTTSISRTLNDSDHRLVWV